MVTFLFPARGGQLSVKKIAPPRNSFFNRPLWKKGFGDHFGVLLGRLACVRGILDPRFQDPGILDPGILDPGILDPGFLDPGILDPGILDPAILDPEIQDSWIQKSWVGYAKSTLKIRAGYVKSTLNLGTGTLKVP